MRWANQLILFVLISCTTPRLNMACPQEPDSPAAIRLGSPQTTVWEMGVEVSVEGGGATGIVATCPLPVDWPEQSVTKLEEDHSENVSRVTYRSLNDAVQLMTVTIPRLEAGETARAVVKLEIAKSSIETPIETDSLAFMTRTSRDVRDFLAPSPYIESRDRQIIQLSKELFDNDQPAWNQVESVFDWIRDNVEYKFDEQIKSSLQALDDGVGDCEELSSVFIAICRAKGIPARAVWVPGHTYPEFYLVDNEGNGHWYPCQIAGAGHDFGRMLESRPILQKGDRFRIPGARQPQRYVRPMLTARDATGTPNIKWILTPVTKTEEPQN